MNKQPILFVHIPKTSGTSFKFMMKNYFGEDSVLCDYSLNSVETSNEIVNYIYKEKDPYKLLNIISQKKILMGHFPIGKYMHMFPTLYVATVLRDPVRQVASHYQHFIAHNNYKGTIEEFVADERFKNIQTKYLQAKPLELFGFIGITERFDDSVALFNHMYRMKLKPLHVNKAIKKLNIDDKIIALIKKENSKDIALYKKALQLFDERWTAYKENREYIYQLIQDENDERVRGIAFKRYQHDIPLKIEIDNYLTIAKDFRSGLLHHNLPRNGYVGFDIKRNKDA